MREIVTATSSGEWKEALEACERNEALAASYQVVDPSFVIHAFDVADQTTLAFDKDALAQTDLPEVLDVTGNSFEDIPGTPEYVRLNGGLVFSSSPLHIDYYEGSRHHLNLWYDVFGAVRVDFVPLIADDYPDTHPRPALPQNQDNGLPTRITDKLLNNKLLRPETVVELDGQTISTQPGMLLAFSGKPNFVIGRHPVAHQFTDLSDRLGILFSPKH